MIFILVVDKDYENISTTKFSRFTVYIQLHNKDDNHHAGQVFARGIRCTHSVLLQISTALQYGSQMPVMPLPVVLSTKTVAAYATQSCTHLAVLELSPCC